MQIKESDWTDEVCIELSKKRDTRHCRTPQSHPSCNNPTGVNKQQQISESDSLVLYMQILWLLLHPDPLQNSDREQKKKKTKKQKHTENMSLHKARHEENITILSWNARLPNWHTETTSSILPAAHQLFSRDTFALGCVKREWLNGGADAANINWWIDSAVERKSTTVF